MQTKFASPQDWIAHRADAAFDKMETALDKTVDRSAFAAQ